MKLSIFRTFLLILVILSLSSLCLAETVILKSGKSIEGKIIEKTDKYIKIDAPGAHLLYFLDEIERIDEGSSNNAKVKDYSYSGTRAEMSAKEIFQRFSPAVVYIETDKSLGSGFLIDKEGIIVTNYHVVELANNITVNLKEGKAYKPTTVLNYDMLKDLCILKINPESDLAFIPLGYEEKEDIGEKVLAIGNPMGMKYSISDGIISQKDANVFREMVQFTCPISSGSSGGPLLNTKGEAIGVVTQLVYPFDGISVAQNINFAVSIDEVRGLLENKKEITLSEFLHKAKRNSPFYTAVGSVSDINEQYNIYKREINKCFDLKDKDCFSMHLTLLALINYSNGSLQQQWSDFVFDGIGAFTYEDNKSLLNYGIEGINLLEKMGGVREVFRLYKLHFNPSEGSERKSLEFTFLVPYVSAAIAYFNNEDLNSLYKNYDIIKEYLPAESETLHILDKLISLLENK